MKGVLTVFGFTFRDQGHRKSYIISTLVMVILVVAAMCVPSIIGAVQGGKGSGTGTGDKGTLYIVDSAKIISSTDVLSQALGGYKIELKNASDQDSVIKGIKSSSKDALAVLRRSGTVVSFDYYVKSAGDGPDPSALSNAFQKLNAAKLLSASGVSGDVAAGVLGTVQYNVHQSGKGMLSGFIPAIAVSLLLFMSIYMYGYWVAMSIASEKTSRVMELLITSTKPSKIVIGKSIAMGALGLIQLLVTIAAAAVTYQLAYPKNFSLGGIVINFSFFTPYYVAMLVLYFVLGFALYAMISAVAGATVSSAEDVRTAMVPVSMVAVIAFYFSYFSTITAPESSSTTVASIIPFCAPFSMPSRILMADVPAGQIAASFILLALTTALMAVISIRLYSAAVLHYGKKLKISELIAMSRH